MIYIPGKIIFIFSVVPEIRLQGTLNCVSIKIANNKNNYLVY